MSYSLEGEDIILDKFFQGKQHGFYVDVGAYHPKLYSNTYLFYEKGWRGINVDATPDSMAVFKQLRPRDINIEAFIAASSEKMLFYRFEEPALNTANESLAKDRDNRGYHIKNTIELPAISLTEILKGNLPSDTIIDFLSVDVEGKELDILRSNDWDLFKPRIILVEISGFAKEYGLDLQQVQKSEVTDFLTSKGYAPFAKTIDTVFFKRKIAGIFSDDFLDNGYWTPQTAMLQSIRDWVSNCLHQIKRALSIDDNPILDHILLKKWPDLEIQKAVYPEVDACDLRKFQDNSFDLVYSHQVLEHIPKPWIAAQEMLRVLKSGGIGIHTTCAFNPRHGLPHFKDYYRFLKEGLAELFDDVIILQNDEWGNKQAILYNVGIDDGHGSLGGRRFHKNVGISNDGLYPWATWIILQKK